jgi:hypothetical protein
MEKDTLLGADMNKQEQIKLFRERYFGRQDVYGRQWLQTLPDGTIRKGFCPCCKLFYTDRCHIKLRDGITCARCAIKEYEPVTDESTWKHISGEEAHIIYLVLDDGTIKHAVLDFDMKIGKEHLGYTFEDVQEY